MVIKRNETYMGHRANAIKLHFVCSECGGKLVEQYHLEGSLIVCAKEHNHAGVTKNSDWQKDHQPVRHEYDEFSELESLSPQVKILRKKVKEENRKALYGE